MKKLTIDELKMEEGVQSLDASEMKTEMGGSCRHCLDQRDYCISSHWPWVDTCFEAFEGCMNGCH